MVGSTRTMEMENGGRREERRERTRENLSEVSQIIG
jgi:hypothetical protein